MFNTLSDESGADADKVLSLERPHEKLGSE
jgi:hypothetical protein